MLNYSNPGRHQSGAVAGADGSIADGSNADGSSVGGDSAGGGRGSHGSGIGQARVTLATMPRTIQYLAGIRIGNAAHAESNRRLLSGWSRLMANASENIAGGRPFSIALADQAIAHCRDHGRDHCRDRSSVIGEAGPAPGHAGVDPPADASAMASSIERSASRLLSVAARHAGAAATLLVDPAVRKALLTHRWTDDRGIVDLITAGTDRDPVDGNTPLQAGAARALIDDVSRHAARYGGVMTEGILAAISDAGLAWGERPGGQGFDTWPGRARAGRVGL